MADVSLGTLYEVNQNLISQQKPMDPVLVNRKLKEIAGGVTPGYWMLFCPDNRQYVVMHVVNTSNTYEVLKEILDNRGTVLDINGAPKESSDIVWEFWVKDIFDETLRMYQLTPYEVVEV